MFFQINVTPKEKKSARKRTEGKEDEHGEQEELYTLVLAPFQPQTRVNLETNVFNSVQCRLNVKNPCNRNLNECNEKNGYKLLVEMVTVSKIPPKERSIELTAMELSVEAESSADLVVTWTPRESGSWRDTLQLTDSRRVKYDVALITTAVGPKKPETKAKSRVLGPSNSNKTSIVSTRKLLPSAPREPKKNANTCGLGPSNVPNKRPRLNAQPCNKENLTKPGWTYETTKSCKRTNILRSPPVHDFSAFMNTTKFNLTPLNTNAPTEQKRQLPEMKIEKPFGTKFSPLGMEIVSPEISNPPMLRRETYTAVKYCRIETVNCDDVNEDDENFADSLSPEPAGRSVPETVDDRSSAKMNAAPSDFSMLINDMNFLTPTVNVVSTKLTNFSPNGCSTGTKTRIAVANASFHEASSLIFPGNDTFDVSEAKAASNSPANGTYELSASPTRSKDSIKPTRLAKTFATTSPSKTEKFEPISSTPLCFERLSMRCDHENSRTSYSQTPRLSTYDGASVKDVLEADLWVKPDVPRSAFSPSSLRDRCRSLEKIEEERNSSVHSRSHSSVNWTKPLPTTREDRMSSKIRRIDITPAKKYSGIVKTGTMRRVSPTKSAEIRKDKTILEQSSSLKKKVQMNCSIKRGQVSCPGVRIANLSLAGLKRTAKPKDKSTIVKNEFKEVSVKLHDPNDFITRICNPDPFSATTTQDPFLTSTLYYDDKWMHHQELEFKKWLNALLTAPEHLDADVDTMRVDVGKVWQSCRAREDVGLAETRETVSARYHTNTHLDALRKAACAYFRRDEVVSALSKATLCVERGILSIRQDRDLHRDIGLQKEILELFLSYNPLWLRIGLETVYGETIPLNSNNDLVGLTRFIITRFFADPFIVKTHSHANATTQKLPTFVVNMNKFILKKFLLVVFFLDYSKRNKLIGHDPCLFHKRATHKESREILLTFSREVLSGVGDVTKVLRAHGYVVSHKQTCLDEYDYAVNELSTDLRDGVRLCRVMELITGDRNLTRSCRVPAISRLQKVHNAEVALGALLRCGYTLTGEIDGKSVADGHREKTLSLLWQIIYKYQAPRFDRAARTVQKWWRAKLWYVRVRNYLRARKFEAASRIQRAWRCRRARDELEKLREERSRLWAKMERAIRAIQLRWMARRAMIEQREKFVATKASILRIQRWYRRRKGTFNDVRELRMKRRASVTIQRHWRAFVAARKARKRYLELVRASVELQNWWRAVLVAKKCRESYEAVKKATSLIQSRWRAVLAVRTARNSFALKRNSARTVQSWWRRYLRLKRDRNDYLLKKHASLIIENWWIGMQNVACEKDKFEKSRRSVIAIQRMWRRYSQTRSYVARFERRRNACKIIQHWWRHARIEKLFNSMRRSCVVIQRWWRGAVSMKSAVKSFARSRRAAIVLQKNWRMKKAREEYIRNRNNVVVMQCWYRNIRISRAVRRDYTKKREAAGTIQKWWIETLEARKLRENYAKLRWASIAIQRRFRAVKMGRRDRTEYTITKRAAIIVQKTWRMHRASTNYEKLKRATLILQSRWRARKSCISRREKFLVLKRATVVVQRRYRDKMCCRRPRNEFLKMRSAVRNLQIRWRANSMMKRDKKQFMEYRRASIVLQSNWRMILERRRYEKIMRAVLTIQWKWRARIVARIVRTDYLILRATVIVVQRRIRANEACRIAGKAYDRARQKIIWIQRVWRAKLQNRMLEEAATKIQTAWRGHRVRTRQSATMKKLRERSKKAAEAALPTATVAYQMQESMDKLLGCETIGQLSMCLATLDTLTRLSLNGSVAFCKRNLVHTIYETMCKSNRSLPWMDVCLKCASILITLAKMPETRNYVYRTEHIETISRLMTITVERRVNVFLQLATLLWLLAENPEYAEAIRSCSRSTWLLTSMIKNKNKVPASNLDKSRCRDQAAPLPNTKPDWGLKQKRPRLFTTVHHAITSILKRLKIDVPT